jgi:hypothetical protein
MGQENKRGKAAVKAGTDLLDLSQVHQVTDQVL